MKVLHNQYALAASVMYWLMLVCWSATAGAQSGACCLGNGSCIVTDAPGCDTVRGEFLGAGATCAAGICNGACCLLGGGCSVGSFDACGSAGGSFQGAGATCEAHCPGPVGSVFTYQGLLKENGEPVTHVIDIQASLWTALIGGDQIGPVLTINAVAPGNDGVFTVQLDFGDAVATFDGDARWLQIAVRSPAGSGPFTTLNPRQSVTGAPYALHSQKTRGIFVDEDDQVAIGTNAPVARLHVAETATEATAVHGHAGGGSGTGVFGLSSAFSGEGVGVLGQATGQFGTGVYGLASQTSGSAVGGRFVSNSFTGRAVSALATGTGGAYGVYAEITSGTFAAVYGLSSGTNGAGYGVFGETAGSSGRGVFGFATSNTGNTYGVQGHVNSPDGWAAHFTGGRNYFQGNVGIGTVNPTFQLHLSNNSAAKPTSNTWTISSDARLKKNIHTIDGGAALGDLLALRGVTYQWIDPDSQGGMDGTYTGFIAQEVEPVFPEWITEDADGYKHLTVIGFEGIVVEALRELVIRGEEKDAQIEQLRIEKDAEIAAMQQRIERLESLITRLAPAR